MKRRLAIGGTVRTPTTVTAETGLGANEIIATGKTNRAANLRKTMGGKVLIQLKKGTKINIYEHSDGYEGQRLVSGAGAEWHERGVYP